MIFLVTRLIRSGHAIFLSIYQTILLKPVYTGKNQDLLRTESRISDIDL
jgi:hypothetical protein